MRRGWPVIPLPPCRKAAHIKGWKDLRLSEADLATRFSPDANIGVLLGEPSRGLVDVDLDCVEAMALAPRLLPSTDVRFGRKRKPQSHWLYVAEPIPRTRQFRDLSGNMLVELRSTGAQTMFPPSRHPSGEWVRWDALGQPAQVNGHALLQRVARLGAAALLARAWPAQGSRQEAALALTGGLLRLKWGAEEVNRFVYAVAQVAGDEEASKRASAAAFTAKRLEAARPATGWTQLSALIGEAVVGRARQWLGAPPEETPAPRTDPLQLTDFAEFQECQGRYVIRRHRRRGTTSEEPISNWVVTPVERLYFDEGGEVLLLRARLVGDDDTRLITLPAKALVGRLALIGALPSTEYVWTGSDKHVQMLRAHLRRSPTTRRQVTGVMGRHGSLIVLPSGTYGPDGRLESAPLMYVNADEDRDFPFGQMVRTTWAKASQVRRAMLAVGRYFCRINRAAVTMPILGWLGALPWATLFRERADAWGGFPHLGLFGSQGAGKTGIGRLLWRLCGIPRTFEPMSLATTPFPRLRALGASNLPPVWVDEFRPSGWPPAVVQALHHELRAVYSGDMLQRGRTNLSVRAFRLRAPIILSGEDWPADTALRERFLAVTPNPEDLNDPQAGFTTTFQKLHRAPLEAFALAYWTWALRQDDWPVEADAARQWVQDLLDRAGCQLPVRAVNNLAIGVFGVQMLQRFLQRWEFDWVDGGVEDAILQQARTLFPGGDRRVALDDLLLFAAAQAHTTLFYGRHWVLSGGDLVLRLDTVVNDLRAFARQSGHPTEILGDAAYRRQVAQLVGQRRSYVQATTKSAKFDEGRVLRGVALSPTQLERTLDIDSNLWRPAAQRGGNARRSG